MAGSADGRSRLFSCAAVGGTSIVANSSLALDHDTRGGGVTLKLMRTPTFEGGMGSHPPAFGEGRWEPLPLEPGFWKVAVTMLARLFTCTGSQTPLAIPGGSRSRDLWPVRSSSGRGERLAVFTPV